MDSKIFLGLFFRFVTMETAVEAEKCISILNNKSIGSAVLHVKPAHTDEEKRRRKLANEVTVLFKKKSYCLTVWITCPLLCHIFFVKVFLE